MSSEKAINLFESSDESSSENEVDLLNVENSYAKKYNDWRRKEELQKLKDKYGDNLDIMSEIEDKSDNELSSDDDDDESEDSLIEDPFDDDFVKVFSALKNKDPKLYEKGHKFFQDDEESENYETTKKKSKSDQKSKLSLQEYHRKLIEEKQGITEEDLTISGNNPEQNLTTKSNGYYEELHDIRNEIKDIVNQNDETDEEDLFCLKNKADPSLTSNKNKNAKKEILSLWKKDEDLDSNEKFLKDYILNRKYIDNDTFPNEEIKKFNNVETHFGGFVRSESNSDINNLSDDNESDDNSNESQQNFPNYHYEEPDANQIKRYPRSINSIRDTINKDKKTKRGELREKKKKEKDQELKRLRKLKREEIESKIQKLKEISGNQSFDAKDLDLNVIIDDETDFDLEKYDQKMKLLFGDSYYNDTNDTSKPNFEYNPEIDDNLYEDEVADLDSKKKKNKKNLKEKKNIMSDDEIGIYEDLIGGEIATRFKYRLVEPNDFGLTDEEIILADDKELNKWCSLKKASQYRSKEEEEYDKKVYGQRGSNLNLKKKILKSVYEERNENDDIQTDNKIPQKKPKRGKKRRKKGLKQPNSNQTSSIQTADNQPTTSDISAVGTSNRPKSKRRKRKNKQLNKQTNDAPSTSGVSLQRLKAYGMSNREIKRMKVV